MPSVSPEEAARLASLARIELADGEAQRLASDLGNILEHVASLEAAEGAAATSAAPERNVFRSDEADARVGVETAKEAFPEREGAFLKVPRVF